MDNCLFCKIINGTIPSTCVYQDEKTYAFRDINPAAPTHVLVVPKVHIEDCNGITAENSAVVAHIFEVIPEIAKAEGKYKGRKPVAINETKFRAVCARWRAGEITATAAMKELDLKPNTFYRRVRQLADAVNDVIRSFDVDEDEVGCSQMEYLIRTLGDFMKTTGMVGHVAVSRNCERIGIVLDI